MSQETYDVLPFPVQIFGVLDRNNLPVEHFVGVYFPVDLMEKMNWKSETELVLSVDKGFLTIYKKDPEYILDED